MKVFALIVVIINFFSNIIQHIFQVFKVCEIECSDKFKRVASIAREFGSRQCLHEKQNEKIYLYFHASYDISA